MLTVDTEAYSAIAHRLAVDLGKSVGKLLPHRAATGGQFFSRIAIN